MCGSHWGPVMPVGLKTSECTLFDGPLRLVALGFQVSNGRTACNDDGKSMIANLFDDPAFDMAGHEALDYASKL